jgi:hypothetical protein
MKKYLLASFFTIFCVLAAFAPPINGRVRLLFYYPPEQLTNVTFNVYHSINIAVPLTNWSILTNISQTQVDLDVIPGEHFFYITATNFWGESGPSNIANTPSVPLNSANGTLQIIKLP